MSIGNLMIYVNRKWGHGSWLTGFFLLQSAIKNRYSHIYVEYKEMIENNRLKGTIASIPDYVFLGVILVVCLLYRIYYFGFLHPGMVLYNSDSVSYFTPVDLLRGIVDLYRTPLYSYIIQFFQCLSEKNFVSNLILFQQVLSLLSIIPFFYVSRKIIGNLFLVLSLTLFYGLWHPILIQNVHLSPESLCFAGSVLMLFLLVRFLENPGKRRLWRWASCRFS